MNIVMASGNVCFTCRAPCMSSSNMTSSFFSNVDKTQSLGVPYRFPKTSAYSRNSSFLTFLSNSFLEMKKYETPSIS